MSRRALALMAVLATFGVAATGVATAAESLDDRLAGVAEEVPAFGGMYVKDRADVLHVYLSDSRAEAPAVEAVRQAFEAQSLPRDVQIESGRYGFKQLDAWNQRLSDRVLDLRGVVLTDVDDADNGLTVGVKDSDARARVKRRIASGGIPEGAVSIEHREPIRPEANLRNRHRPLFGGLQIASRRGSNVESLCTLGFNVVRAGVAGFVTNSHCTRVRGGVESTVFHQPTTFSSGNRVGVETADRRLFTGGACPAGRRCRFSDTAFVKRDSGISARRGRVAAPNDFDTLSWDGSSTYRLVRDLDPVVGDVVRKVGRTTGMTRGSVVATCANVNVSGSDITMLCQDEADYTSAGGDSGSPVFSNRNDPAPLDSWLRGIHWGGGGGSTVFSPISNIQRSGELGPLTDCAGGFSC